MVGGTGDRGTRKPKNRGSIGNALLGPQGLTMIEAINGLLLLMGSSSSYILWPSDGLASSTMYVTSTVL